MLKKSWLSATVLSVALAAAAGPARAAAMHDVFFKSPGPGMHFTEGQIIIVLADLFDRTTDGFIENGQGWPQLQVLVDGTPWKDSVSGGITLAGTTMKDMNGNPSPIDFNRFSLAGVPAGTHQLTVRGVFAPPPLSDGASVDGPSITIVVDPAPTTKTLMNLTADVTGPVAWDNVFVVGNGHVVKPTGAVTIKNSLVTGLGGLKQDGITGSATSLDIEGSIFEATGAVTLKLSGTAIVKNSEFRSNNLLTFNPTNNPDLSPTITLTGKSDAMKLFQGNRVGAGRVWFDGTSNWLVGGDTDDLSNVVIGPRGTFYFTGSTNITFRGNYDHHNYHGGWSQGFNLSFACLECAAANGSGVIAEHNVLRGGSWPVQDVIGEFRYNVVYGFGHDWMRSALTGASIHHNLFVPEDVGDLDSGILLYVGEKAVQIYNNTFDGGGKVAGDFAGNMVRLAGTVQVASLRNNLFTFSRDAGNGPGKAGIQGDAGTLLSADYNAFYSPDNTTKDNYNVAGLTEGTTAGFATHDVSGGGVGVKDGQLSATPFAGARIYPIAGLVDEGAVWNGTQKVSTILAAFRARYAPAAGAPIIDAGDPADNDSMGRRADIGAIDTAGHDQDKLGKFGAAPSETVAPTATLTAPAAGASLTGKTTLSATAMDNAGGSGVVLVQFLVDGNTVGQVATSPYSISFNTAIVSNAVHTFTAKAWDAAGNFGVSAPVMATVAGNAPGTVPTTGAGGTTSVGGSGAGGGPGAAGSQGAAGTGATGAGGGGPGGASGAVSGKGGCGCGLGGGSSARGGLFLGLFSGFLSLGLSMARRRARARR